MAQSYPTMTRSASNKDYLELRYTVDAAKLAYQGRPSRFFPEQVDISAYVSTQHQEQRRLWCNEMMHCSPQKKFRRTGLQ